ncbi:hypothetical protein [uncultured Agitococcus sp.]|uniref:hypothetical protein n=1 Tax=uncultured Agitococcus sp. TaxID=1506599 RepID=UPI002618F3D8|nr:hypothetical protein [uncultured Agitococcus sp.]
MKKTIVILLAQLAISGSAIAADNVKTAKKTTASSEVNISSGTDVIGSKDAPLVLNIVSWKDKENYLPKNPLSASVLEESLAPIDRDVVSREVNYSRALQELSPLSTISP